MSLIQLPYQANISERFSHFSDMQWSMLFDSCEQARFDWFSSLPSKTLTLTQDNRLIEKSFSTNQTLAETNIIDQDIFSYLNLLEQDKNHPNELPFTGGWLGYLSYDLGFKKIIGQSNQKDTTFKTPLAQFGFFDWAYINDHKLKKSYLWFDCADSKQQIILNIFEHSKKEFSEQVFNFDWKNLTQGSTYMQNIQTILDYIIAGDCYQTNYTQCWEADIKQLDCFSLYQSRKQKCPTPYSGFIRTPELVLSSHSPEAFISIKDNQIDTFPIKGTIKRSDDPLEDALLKSKLASSEKDRAENIMITDLLRNDLSITAKPSTVKCPEICKVHSFSNVHHLISHVTAKLNDSQYSMVDVIKHAFPGGSITGAPKKRAMEIIDELEDQSRSLYCGSMIAISKNNQIHSNILIRSFIYFENKLRCYAGGGIVMDSDAKSEFEESLSKVSILKD